MGPNLDFTLNRTQWAPPEIKTASLKKPKGLEPSKVKNITRNVFGEKVGRVHMKVQDLNTLQTRKMRGLKTSRDKKVREAGDDGHEE
jgi:ribosome production factor 2